jgi:hypothetical protein
MEAHWIVGKSGMRSAQRPDMDVLNADVRRLAVLLVLVPGLGCSASTTRAVPSDGGLDAGANAGQVICSDASPCVDADIRASNYDQTCQTNSDCVLVVEGQVCAPCAVCAPLSAINRSALSQYEADVANIVAPVTGGGGCAPCCGPIIVACCQSGRCRAGTSCSADAGAE